MKLTIKQYCPHCGRCIGYVTSSDDSNACRVLVDKPKKLRKTEMMHEMLCTRCKEPLYIVMGYEQEDVPTNSLATQV